MNTRDISILAAMAIAFTACKKDEAPPPTNNGGGGTPTTATVKLSYSFTVGTAPFDPTVTFVDENERKVRITKLKFYAHDVHLTDDEASTVGEFHDGRVLINALAGTNEFVLGTMDPGHIHNVSLAFGLDSTSSYGFPDQVTAPVPLNDEDMTWPWNSVATMGRMFVKFEGFWDVNENNVQDDGEGFQYHAMGATPVPANYHVHRDVVAGTAVSIDLKVDLRVLVSPLGLDGMFHSPGSAESQQVLQNLATATSPL